ncbi:MAG: MBL fold metallo-hydrolase [Prevotella sp.]|nr:MBL fold metallo-hydrolase [Prevotella sp.]
MKLRFLGTGTSAGVPVLGCQCAVCKSTDARDQRFRTAALLESEKSRILIDCGPDIRQQLMPLPFVPFDGVLLTHIHYDHVGGLDDLRGYCVFGDINVYADERTAEGLKTTMPYCFTEHLYPGVPKLNLHTIAPHIPLHIGDVEVMPIQVMHGKLPILGYRFGKMAYITDMKTIDDAEMAYLQGVEVLVVNALRFDKPHHSHQLVDDAIAFAQRVGAKKTYLVHVTHEIGFHDDANSRLPEGFEFPYDGLTFSF